MQDFLTMRLGFERQSGRNYGRWAASDDWVCYTLTRHFTAEPGDRMLYSTAGWHGLGAWLFEVTETSLLKLSREWLGKVGGVKTRTSDPRALEGFLALIDTMPMRRAEMRSRGVADSGGE